MLKFLRFVIVFFLIASAVIYIATYLMKIEYQKGCHHETHTIEQKEGRFVVLREMECCSGCYISIKILRAESPSISHEAFCYYESGESHLPVIIWSGENELEVQINNVGHIVQQNYDVDGVKITYKIGYN